MEAYEDAHKEFHCVGRKRQAYKQIYRIYEKWPLVTRIKHKRTVVVQERTACGTIQSNLGETSGREHTQFFVRHLPTLILVHGHKPGIASSCGNRLAVKMRKRKLHVLVVHSR